LDVDGAVYIDGSIYGDLKSFVSHSGRSITIFAHEGDNLTTKYTEAISHGTNDKVIFSLAPGTYSWCGVAVTTPVHLTVKGAGKDSTIISCSQSGATNVFNFSGQDANSYIGISDLSISVPSADAGAAGIFIDQIAGTSLLESQINISNVRINVTGTFDTDCISIVDSGFNVDNVQCVSTTTGTVRNARGIYQKIAGSSDSDLTSRISNSSFMASAAASNSSYSGRGMMFWYSNTSHSFNNTVKVENTISSGQSTLAGENVACYCVNDDNALTNSQNCYYNNVICDGRSAFGSQRAFRATADNNGLLNIYWNNVKLFGTTYRTNLVQTSGTNTVFRSDGIMFFKSVENSAAYSPAITGTNSVLLDGIDLMSITGETGGSNILTTGTSNSGEGADVLITSGLGGSSVGTTGGSTAGSGGDFELTGGAGGAQTNASGTTNTGGAGGYLQLKAGAGGAANSGSSTDAGGNGGSVYLVPGAGGVGTDSTGTAGNIYIGVATSGAGVGNISMGTTSSVGLVTIGTTSPSRTSVDGTNDLIVKDAVEVDGNVYVDGSIYNSGIYVASGNTVCYNASGKFFYVNTSCP
jgi:hypothetical protein